MALYAALLVAGRDVCLDNITRNGSRLGEPLTPIWLVAADDASDMPSLIHHSRLLEVSPHGSCGLSPFHPASHV